MENLRNQLYGRVQLFFVCVTRCFCCGLDTNFLTLFLHERFLGPLLLVSNCVFYGGILIGGLVVWLDGYARFDLCACLFVLLSLKVVALCVMAIGLLDVVFLTLLGFVGFFIGSEQSLIFGLSLQTPNPAKKLLVHLCYAGFSFGHLVSSLFLDQNIPGDVANGTSFYSNYRSFNVLPQLQIHSSLDPSSILITSAVVQCFLGYSIYDLWKDSTTNIQLKTSDGETTKDEYASQVEWIAGGMAFLGVGLVSIVQYYVFVFSLNELSKTYLHAFLFGCLAGRILLVIFACKFPAMFWLCLSLVISGFSISCFVFEELKPFSPAIYGVGLSLLLPALTSLLLKYKGASIHPLIAGSVLGTVCVPIIFIHVMQQYGSELFTAVNFLTLLIMVICFVRLLNIQSITERPEDESHAKIWILFQGQGVKRANSIRKFISSFRESIRERTRSYRRLRRFQRSPNPNLTLVGESSINAARTYRSTEGSKNTSLLQLTKRLYNSVDETPQRVISLSPIIKREESSPISN